MANLIKMTAGDTGPDQPFVIKQNGVVVNLTGATVRLKIKRDDTAAITNASANTCTITSATAGACKYVFATGDIPSSATDYSCTCDLEVTDAGGKVITYDHPIIAVTAEVV